MVRNRAISDISTNDHQKDHLKISLTGAPSPAIKGTITDLADKTKIFAHLLMPELPQSTTSAAERRAEVRWNKRFLVRFRKSLDWKRAEAIEDSDDTVIAMILQCRPNECQAPHEGILRQASDAYWETKSERDAQKAAAEEVGEAEQCFSVKYVEDGFVIVESGEGMVDMHGHTTYSATQASLAENADVKQASSRAFSWSDTFVPYATL